MIDLVDFLLARIAEDRSAVENARYDPADHWWLPEPAYPSRLLAECEAKRRIVELHPLTTDVVPVHSGPQPGVGCETCHTVTAASVMDPDYVEALGTCETLLALALPYADHPDFREEWRP